MDTIRAWAVHVLTACGAALALMALIFATGGHWEAMFFCLGLALIVDGIDGPLAREFKVAEVLPRWSGETLDLVVDFVTYVFVPAYAVTASGLLLPVLAPLLGVGVVVSGALYFADRRMKSEDNHFRGFPGLWNLAAFYLFLLHWPPLASSALVLTLIVATFLPFHVLHPVRVVRLRRLTLSLVVLWAVLALHTVIEDFDVGVPVVVTLCAIAAYVVASDAAIRWLRSFKT